MLTDHDQQLISAAVDGQLSVEDESQFRVLVAESTEALQLFQSLQSHSHRLHSLPQRPAPSDFEFGVMSRVRQLPIITPSSPHRNESGKRSVGWMPYVIAASLLFAVTSASFWFAAQYTNRKDAITQRPHLTKSIEAAHNKTVSSPRSLPEVGNEILPQPQLARTNVTDTTVVQRTTNMVELAPEPRHYIPGDVIGSATFVEQSPLMAVQARMPFLANVADLDKPDVRTRFVDELGRDPAFRFDLFTRDPLKAAEVFQTIAKQANINLAIDGTVQDRVNKRHPSAWVIYVESLSAEEIAKLFDLLAVQCRGDEKSPSFTTGHLFPAFQTDANQPDTNTKDLRDLLGVDLGLGKRPKTAATKPLTATTVDQVTSALQKNVKPALMLTYLPVIGRSNPALSVEVQSFLAKRDERKPGVVPLMIVIRPLN